ncbi:MAG: TolC family protein [Alphaproteobacteria bacterium]|nr:TolC family protein [Alphaproteobacteria bacterium]HPF47822.1 TolC family protein [Emcibacteraceae bacterium]
MLIRVIFFTLVIWPCVLMAQQAETPEFEIIENDTLTLHDVVNAAMARSPDLGVVKSKEENANALRSRASSLFADTPEISLKMQNDRFMSNQGLREWESALEMPLWMPGQKSASRQKARMSTQEARAYQDLALFNVTGQVREQLWQIKIASAALEQARANLKIAEDLDRDIQKRIEAGNLPRQDELLSQKEVMSRKMELITAQAEFIHAGKRYESVTGLTEYPTFFEEEVDHSEDNENAPIIRLYNAKVDYLDAAYNEQRNSWSSAPKLSVGVKRETASYTGQNINSVGVSVLVPLGAGAHMKSKRSEAALALAEMERERELIKREYRLALHEAEHELEVCEAELPLSATHFELAKENLRLGQKAFDMGETNLFDFLKIQEQYFSSAAANKKIIIECKRAVARHNQVKGVLLP